MSDHTSQPTGWHLERSAPEAYEQYLVPPIFAPWADRLIQTSAVEDGDRVLDLACGTGIVARRAASRIGESGSVVGIDSNEAMLAVAKEIATNGPHAIEWRQGDATDLPFSDESFDVVCCQQALQFFDDPGASVRQMRRVLAPGGRVAVSVWRPLDYQPGYEVLADSLEHHVSEEAGTMMRSPFPAWDGKDLRAFVQDGGFDDVSVTIEIGSVRYPSVEEFVRREAASSPLAEPIAAVERTVRDELVQEVAEAVLPYGDDKGVVFPMESYVVTAGG